jgi:hypothetical protein
MTQVALDLCFNFMISSLNFKMLKRFPSGVKRDFSSKKLEAFLNLLQIEKERL